MKIEGNEEVKSIISKVFRIYSTIKTFSWVDASLPAMSFYVLKFLNLIINFKRKFGIIIPINLTFEIYLSKNSSLIVLSLIILLLILSLCASIFKEWSSWIIVCLKFISSSFDLAKT